MIVCHSKSELLTTAQTDRMVRQVTAVNADIRSAGDGASSANSPAMSRRYVLVTPCRDEAQYARRTIESVLAQTVRPTLWVIVNDGSTDATPQIIDEYAQKHEFIRVIHRENRGFRKLGGGVIDAFNHGLESVRLDDFDYVCKFDLDLDIPPQYFEKIMDRMELNPRIGTCSGKPYMQYHGRLVREVCGDENSVGMIKFYRVECFKQIGGFVREVMWDGIDGHRCRMLGWIAGSFDDEQIRFQHLRPMGTSHRSWWTGRARHGAGQYFMGTGLTYILASAAYRLFHPPYVVGGIAMVWGYLIAMLRRKPRYGDGQFRSFLRNYQWACLLKGKSRATRAINQAQAAAWGHQPNSGIPH